MVNPIESDTKAEWIELYNPTQDTINLSNWKIKDNYATDKIIPANKTTPLFFPPHSFIIITDQDTTLTMPHNENHSVLHYMVDDNSICNGLGNTKDCLLLLNENGSIIDSVEWGFDTEEVTGQPINTPGIGNSLILLHHNKTNNSHTDYAETTIPTLGKENKFSKTGSIQIDILQKYIPKIAQYDTYSPPFAIHVTLSNFSSNGSYKLKSYITGNVSSQYPASQTWTGEQWQYSDRYTHTITTNKTGCWNDWIFLRFSKTYEAYKKQIQHNKTCSIHIKVKDNYTIKETRENSILLDVDNLTTQGVKGGYFINVDYPNTFLCLTDEFEDIVSCYPSEPNNIVEYTPEIEGYHKLTGPLGSDFTLNSITQNGLITELKNNITISFGSYHFKAQTSQSNFDRKNRNQFSTSITIQNTGSLTDTYYILLSEQSPGFHARLETKEITLDPNQKQKVKIYIDPFSLPFIDTKHGNITIKIISKNDPVLQKDHVFTCRIHQPDLTIPNVKSYNQNGEQTETCYEGNIVRIKAFLKNNGEEHAQNVTVSYFLDEIQSDSLIYTKTYETVKQYQKYPSLYWDTKGVSPGEHTIYILADYHNTITELNEQNNKNNISITILDSTPSKVEKQLLITECYYYAHPTIHNEYISLYNPTNESIQLDEWYITTTVNERFSDQKKIMFPKETIIEANTTITLTQNSNDFYTECLTLPDYEYETDANHSVDQLETTSTIFLNNKGGMIALKDSFNHTIDGIVYGNTIGNFSFWNGSSIPSVKQGEILKRCIKNNGFVDTNTAVDWIQPQTFHIGQSRFNPRTFCVNASITPFVSPDTSFRVLSRFFNQADSEILLNVYEFTSMELTNLLLTALQRNVTVKILAEGNPIGGMSEKQQYLFNRLIHHGAIIHILRGDVIQHQFKRYRFTHAKYAILDQKTVIIQSGNYAPTGVPKQTSRGNREWGVAITNKSIASFYTSVFYNDFSLLQPDTNFYSSNLDFYKHNYFVLDPQWYGCYQPIINQTSTFTNFTCVQPVLSPDNSLTAITDLISQANESIYIQQLYIYSNWSNNQNPLIPLLTDKARQGVDIRIILNYNPWYTETNFKNNQTKNILEANGIQVKYIYTNWSIFQNIHNKGVIIDNISVLISSVNWNENSFLNNREVGIIINHPHLAQLYSTVFLSDWTLTDPNQTVNKNNEETSFQFIELNANTIYITALFTMTFIVVIRDWRKRSWP